MDVFDEGIGDDILPDDWAKIERARRTNGYKEGVAAGQESSLQQGFNSGFSSGVTAKFSSSFIKGIINALITSLHPRVQETEDDVTMETIKELENILSDLDSLQLPPRSCSKGSSVSTPVGYSDDDTTSCVDSESSHNVPSTSTSTLTSACRCEESRDNAPGKETNTQADIPGRGSEESHMFYSRNPQLAKIIDRLRPYLEKYNCQESLCVSHPFLSSS